jgi:hypothetical protein
MSETKMSETKYVTKEQLEESMKALEKKLKKEKRPPRPPKEPNDYNNFMKDQIPKVKKENPGLNNKEAFSKSASDWAKAKTEIKKENKKETEKTE